MILAVGYVEEKKMDEYPTFAPPSMIRGFIPSSSQEVETRFKRLVMFRAKIVFARAKNLRHDEQIAVTWPQPYLRFLTSRVHENWASKAEFPSRQNIRCGNQAGSTH